MRQYSSLSEFILKFDFFGNIGIRIFFIRCGFTAFFFFDFVFFICFVICFCFFWFFFAFFDWFEVLFFFGRFKLF
ncbi:hypothetical protein DXB47_03875 [Firmicutes bacterium OM04-13BH]|nr:hypothetical protein DW128_03900 [Firmicutes bacterium AM10-47]RHV46724.1 hypothetical protein DXB47_03875 [Firmicutes bacterium OM04-13BH]